MIDEIARQILKRLERQLRGVGRDQISNEADLKEERHVAARFFHSFRVLSPVNLCISCPPLTPLPPTTAVAITALLWLLLMSFLQGRLFRTPISVQESRLARPIEVSKRPTANRLIGMSWPSGHHLSVCNDQQHDDATVGF